MNTSLEELGEFGLIDRLTKDIVIRNESTVVGIGDDAAVLDYGGKQTVVSTDMLVEHVHFDLMYVPLKHLGYKSVVVNLSDIYAMNAQPKQVTVSVAVSNRFPVEALEELYSGVKLACETYGVDLIGGDTTSSNKGLIISVTVLGEGEKDKLVYRSGAQENDLICVSGDLGGAYAGLMLLEREKEVFRTNPDVQPELSAYPYVLERQLKPEARKEIIDNLAELGVKPTSMIDISDGLSSELLHICASSKVGCKVFDEKIPIHQQTVDVAKEFDLDPTTFAMNGGEDYELLFTVPLADHQKIVGHPDFAIIGHVCSADVGSLLIARDGTTVELVAQGWNALQGSADDGEQ